MRRRSRTICNLRCRYCSHHSSYLAPNFYSLEQFTEDVHALSGVSVAGELRLIGGEPPLHPEVDDFLFAAKASGVAEKLSVYTNGILLDKMTVRFFDLVDFVHLSAYPVTSPKHSAFEAVLLDRARRFNVEFHMGQTDTFYDIETSKLSDKAAQQSYEAHNSRAYTHIKDSLREIPRLRNFVRYSPIGSHLFQILDPVLSSVQKIPEPHVPIRPHENMSREECAPRSTAPLV